MRSFNSRKQLQAREYNTGVATNLQSKKREERWDEETKATSAFVAHLAEANRVRKEREARMFREVRSK